MKNYFLGILFLALGSFTLTLAQADEGNLSCSEGCQKFSSYGSCLYQTKCAWEGNCVTQTSCGYFSSYESCLAESRQKSCQFSRGEPITCTEGCQKLNTYGSCAYESKCQWEGTCVTETTCAQFNAYGTCLGETHTRRCDLHTNQ